MKNPRLINFEGNCLEILSSSLLAVAPEEGCALLIGDQQQCKGNKHENLLRIQLIWPCCNIWRPDIFNLVESSNELKVNEQSACSKEKRFALDPREQLYAQRWAREHNWWILGSAHSHPKGSAIPSSVDLTWTNAPGLMAIVDRLGTVRVWWIANDQNSQPIEVEYLNHK